MNQTPDNLRNIYDCFAPHYDRHIIWLERIAGLRKLRRDFLLRASGDVLDIATGTGSNFEFFDASCHITGFDLSPKMLELAKIKAEKFGRKTTRETPAERCAVDHQKDASCR